LLRRAWRSGGILAYPKRSSTIIARELNPIRGTAGRRRKRRGRVEAMHGSRVRVATKSGTPLLAVAYECIPFMYWTACSKPATWFFGDVAPKELSISPRPTSSTERAVGEEHTVAMKE